MHPFGGVKIGVVGIICLEIIVASTSFSHNSQYILVVVACILSFHSHDLVAN